MNVLNLFDNKVKVGISELSDGNMRFFDGMDEFIVKKNQHTLANRVEADKAARLRTIYGDERSYTDYVVLGDNFAKYDITNSEKDIPVTDGLATQREYGLLLPLADCLGVVLFDPEHRALGLVHSGRQNLENSGLTKFVDFLKQNYQTDPDKLQVYFSPCAQDYTVYKFDELLPKVAENQLLEAGVKKENITKSTTDTVSSPNFPSHSSQDNTTRFAIIAKLI